jgi:ferredoxin
MSAPRQAASSKAFSAALIPSGSTFVAPCHQTLLQSAELAKMTGVPGLNMESSCRNGSCRTCICLLTSGHVAYRIEWPGLSLEEKLEGYILPCVAYPLSDVVLELQF